MLIKRGLLIGGVLAVGLAGTADGFVHPTQNPSISGTPRVGSVLTCNPGTWDGPVDSFDYSWSLLSDVGNGGSGNPFATGQTWAADQAHAGQDIVCDVTAHAADGTTTTDYSHYVTIQQLGATPCSGALRDYTGRSSQGLEVQIALIGNCVTDLSVIYLPRCTGSFAGHEFTYGPRISNTPLDSQGHFNIKTSRKPRGYGRESSEIATTKGLVSGNTATGIFTLVSRFYIRHRLVAACRVRSLRWSART